MRIALMMLAAGSLGAQVAHYSVVLRPDFEKKVLRGIEEVTFRDPARASLAGGRNLTITRKLAEGHFEYEAKPGQGFRWLDDGTVVTMFHCGAWMLCDASPGYRATLRLEIVVPAAASAMRAIGPGRLTKQYRDSEGEHFVYEVRNAAQSFLFSFAVARLERSVSGNLEVLSVRPGGTEAVARSAEAYRFFRQKAGVDLPDPHYAQAFLSMRNVGQEAAGMALMSQTDLEKLESRDSVELMAHELAHQWWAVLVGIRSWSDFWLNEGIAEFMTAAFVEHHLGRAAYDAKIRTLEGEMAKLRAEGKDRPLHWEKWTDAVNALGPVPYRKGALFLHRLRGELGEERFWRGIALYTRRSAGKLVDSRDFQSALEEAAGRSLGALFEEQVYR